MPAARRRSWPRPPCRCPPVPGETHLANITQLTHGGNNAEAYFSRSGTQLIFQRQEEVTAGCDQEYIMNIDGSGLRRVSNGLGRTTCGYFYDNDKRILYSSTFEHDPACPARPDMSKGYVWPLGSLRDLHRAQPTAPASTKLTDDKAYNAEATVSPDGKRIIFTSTRDGDIDLYSDEHRRHGRPPDHLADRLRRRGLLLAQRQADRLARLLPGHRRRHRGLPRACSRSAWCGPPTSRSGWPTPTASDPRQVTHLGGANFAPVLHATTASASSSRRTTSTRRAGTSTSS